MKSLTIKKNDIITHGPSKFESDELLQEHLNRHEGMGTYGLQGEYEVIIEDITDQIEQEAINQAALSFLASTDYKILRHLREIALGLPQTLSDSQYLALELQRNEAAASIK